MKFLLVIFLFLATTCFGQPWEVEIAGGISGYKGDLIKRNFTFQSVEPAIGVNLKYNLDNMFLLRAGISLLKVKGYDKNNTQVDIKARNLSFQSNILEFNVGVEYNLLEPEIFHSYPYIFAGIGVYHFNPFTYDDSNVKTYLRPLSTEGQGLSEYPERKPYAQTQLCVPFGGGWKWNLSPRYQVLYEIGYRALFTDYLDDVSKTYVDPQVLLAAKGPKAVELAYRAQHSTGSYPFPEGPGDQRGNPKAKDWYFFNGVKFLVRLGKIY